ncbi:MAG: hypothetical protein R3C40_02660 [Parvularculaceae bacterium]
MISLDDAARQFTGVWKMAFSADDWRRDLDRTEDGVFRSFWAMAFTAPLVALFSVTSFRALLKNAAAPDLAVLDLPLSVFVSAKLVSFALEWTACLTFLLVVARAGGAGRRAADIIVGYNWIQPITVAAQGPAIALIAATGDVGIGGFLVLPALGLSLALYWGVIRKSMETAVGQTMALIAALYVIGLSVDAGVTAIAMAFFASHP